MSLLIFKGAAKICKYAVYAKRSEFIFVGLWIAFFGYFNII